MARITLRSAARAWGKDSSAEDEPARRTISGLMESYPNRVGALMAQRPVMKVITVRENSVGRSVGMTTRKSTLKGFMLRAASTVL